MSPENFSLLEAVELAINMEEEGVRFYSLALEKMKDQDMKKVFSLLREKEYSHINTFRKLFSDMAAREGDPDAGLYLIDPEIGAYFRAFVEATVFPVKGAAQQAIGQVSDVRDILRLGLQVEKDSIHYYQELAHHSAYPQATEILRRVATEERRHFQDLYNLWVKMAGEKGWGPHFARHIP